ncbi:hypothetical protein N5853_10980 [Bartonella sp. HY329]|uniref:hypothetical protein n=1 Tax=unclassified Bartonella TaxID=2645622 RepID=UPI0021CAE23F|nr:MULTISPECIES: hypothetical protein [unclassified Bartonella]UXM94617.1 hypothetical protein N5853_10980 [Bartonella sp. HY329]UXN08940.1 hypothetical protein N5852_10990 [Bartonella sp. HY328]
MKFSGKLASILIASIGLSLVNMGHVFAAEKPMVSIIKDSAVAEVIRAKRKGDIVEIELRFNTVVEPFSGAIIYDKLDRDTVFISNGDEKWQLTAQDDAAPQDLKLNFSYDMTKTPRVGQWKGKFVAPPADINEISLHITGLPVIEKIIIK